MKTHFLTFLLIVVAVLAGAIFLPYLSALALATVLAIIFRPFWRWLRRHAHLGDGLAALVAVIIVLALIITPLFFIGQQMFEEMGDLYDKAASADRTALFSTLDAEIENILGIRPDTASYAREAVGWLGNNIGRVFGSAARTLGQLFVALIAFFYLLRDGARLKVRLVELSPLPDGQDREIFEKLHAAVNSVIRGTLMIAIIQGTLAGLGFAIFGVPHPALWGLIAMLAAFIPGVGTSLVLVPAIIYAFATGPMGLAIGLAIWGAVAVGLVDNFLGPKLIGGRIHVHPLLILLSVLGGLGIFGSVGFLLGPLVISLLFALLDANKEAITA